MSFARKAKSLVGRWLAKSADGVPDCGGDALTTNEIIIERDVVVLLNVKIRQGASAATVACHYRVLNIDLRSCLVNYRSYSSKHRHSLLSFFSTEVEQRHGAIQSKWIRLFRREVCRDLVGTRPTCIVRTSSLGGDSNATGCFPPCRLPHSL